MHFEEARLVISIVPPCCSTIPSAMVSPSPGPPVLQLRDLPRWKAAKAATRRGAGIPGPPVVDDCLNTPVLLAHGHARLLAVARRVADDVRERAREDGSPATRNGPPSSRRSVTAAREARRFGRYGRPPARRRRPAQKPPPAKPRCCSASAVKAFENLSAGIRRDRIGRRSSPWSKPPRSRPRTLLARRRSHRLRQARAAGSSSRR